MSSPIRTSLTNQIHQQWLHSRNSRIIHPGQNTMRNPCSWGITITIYMQYYLPPQSGYLQPASKLPPNALDRPIALADQALPRRSCNYKKHTTPPGPMGIRLERSCAAYRADGGLTEHGNSRNRLLINSVDDPYLSPRVGYSAASTEEVPCTGQAAKLDDTLVVLVPNSARVASKSRTVAHQPDDDAKVCWVETLCRLFLPCPVCSGTTAEIMQL